MKRHYQGWRCDCFECRWERRVNRAIAVFLVFVVLYLGAHVIAFLVKGM